jgi:arylsulfatase A-like enzyme
VLLITTDDQNVSDLVAMPRTRRLLQAHGMTFTGALSPHPLCCPARAEILTGQYAQNNGVRHNHGPFGGFSRLDPTRTLGTWLQAAGYRTAFTGKYLNGYGASSPRPPGWDLWDPMVGGIYDYWGTEFRRPRAGDERRYSVDAVAERTLDYLARFARRNGPFFVWSSQIAPHATAGREGSWNPPRVPARQLPVPAARAPSLDNPSFTTRPRSGSPCVCDRTSWTRADVERFHRARLLSLQAVDLAVARAARVLADAGHLLDTYVFFTTDNAFLMGEHGYFGKSTLYEEDLRIPLLVRGPGVVQGARSRLPVTLTDLAPTILQIAHARGVEHLDGTSFLPTLRHRPQRWRDTQLIQTGSLAASPGASGWGHRGVRTSRYTYGVEPDTGRELLLDRRLDRYEQQNRADDPAYASVLRELRRRTSMLTACRGAACSLRFGPVPPVSSREDAPSRR